jgi:hypothetical protein
VEDGNLLYSVTGKHFDSPLKLRKTRLPRTAKRRAGRPPGLSLLPLHYSELTALPLVLSLFVTRFYSLLLAKGLIALYTYDIGHVVRKFRYVYHRRCYTATVVKAVSNMLVTLNKPL